MCHATKYVDNISIKSFTTHGNWTLKHRQWHVQNHNSAWIKGWKQKNKTKKHNNKRDKRRNTRKIAWMRGTCVDAGFAVERWFQVGAL